MVNAVIILILVIVLIFATKSSIKHFKGEGACCGGGSGTVRRPKPKKKKLNGPVTAHYMIEISGMHCQNCVNGVTRAINAIDGAAAKVSLKNNSAEVSCDRDVDKEKLKRAVEDAGYKVISIRRQP